MNLTHHFVVQSACRYLSSGECFWSCLRQRNDTRARDGWGVKKSSPRGKEAVRRAGLYVPPPALSLVTRSGITLQAR